MGKRDLDEGCPSAATPPTKAATAAAPIVVVGNIPSIDKALPADVGPTGAPVPIPAGQIGLDRTLDGATGQEQQPLLSSAAGLPVEHWDRYQLIALVGQGGMGSVYKGQDRRLGRTVAIKFIRGSDVELTKRFLQEARAQSRVDHPGICKVYDVGEVAGKSYIAMQYIDGQSLQDAARSMTLQEKVQVIKATAEAIHAAHEIGIIHRDIKPAKVPSVENAYR